MDRRGMTLAELVMTMVLGTVLLLAMTSQFVADLKFRSIIRNQNIASQEASVITDQMIRILRFARAGTVSTSEWGMWGYVEGGHNVRGFAPGTATFVEYANISGELRYYYNCNDSTGPYTVIARGLNSFILTKSGDNLNMNFEVKKGDQRVKVNTAIRMLGA